MSSFVLYGQPLTPTERGLTLTGAGLGVGLGLYGLWRAYWGYTHHGPTAALYWPRPYLLLSVVLLGATLAYFFPRWKRARQRWVLSAQGVHLPRRKVAWDEIEGLVTDFTPRRRRLVLLTTQGTLRIEPDPEVVPSALAYLEARLYPSLAVRWRNAWRQGRAIPCGPWQISPTGIRVGRRWVPWAAVRQIGLRQGRLVIELKHRTLALPVRRAPNAALLVRWLHQEGHQ